MSPISIIQASAAGVVAALSAACASTRVTPFDPNARPSQRTPASEIRFYSTTTPRCPYEEIGRISAESEPFVTWGRVVKAARNAAHDMGGDAVINVRDDTRLSGASVSTSGVSVDEKSSISGVVIRFKQVDCMD